MPFEKAARLDGLPPYLYMAIRRRISEAQARGVDVISLGVGDPDQPTPAHVVSALCDAAGRPENHRYPTDEERGMRRFRDSIASWYDRRFGVVLDPESEVLALIGSKEANHHLALAALDPGDLALIPDPGYPAYVASAVIAGAEVARVPMVPERGYLLDFASIDPALARRARVLWLNYPNNPTGAVATIDFFAEAIQFARAYDLLVVNDNPYSEITFDGFVAPSILAVPGAIEVAVEFNSLSKPYNMTGWRVGMAVGNRDVIAAIAQVKENTDSGIFNPIQLAAIAALDGPTDVILENVERYRARRDSVVSALQILGLPVEPPQGTFYVWAPTPPGMTGIEFAERLLEVAGVVVTPGIGYGSGGVERFRVSLSVDDARLSTALDRIVAARSMLTQVEPMSAIS